MMSKKYAGEQLVKLLRVQTEPYYPKPMWAKESGIWAAPNWPHDTTWDAAIAGDRTGATKLEGWYQGKDRPIFDRIRSLKPYDEVYFRHPNNQHDLKVEVLPSALSLNQGQLYQKNAVVNDVGKNQVLVFGSDGTNNHRFYRQLIQLGANPDIPTGLQGQTYGFLAVPPGRHASDNAFLDQQVEQFYDQAKQRPDLEFIVPASAPQKIKGLSSSSIRDRFVERSVPSNVSLPGNILYPEYKDAAGGTYALRRNDLFGDLYYGEDKYPNAERWRNRWMQLEGWNERYLDHLLEDGGGVIHQFQYRPLAVVARPNTVNYSGLYGGG